MSKRETRSTNSGKVTAMVALHRGAFTDKEGEEIRKGCMSQVSPGHVEAIDGVIFIRLATEAAGVRHKLLIKFMAEGALHFVSDGGHHFFMTLDPVDGDGVFVYGTGRDEFRCETHTREIDVEVVGGKVLIAASYELWRGGEFISYEWVLVEVADLDDVMRIMFE